ncbi:hypothetical protein RSAG8_11437, partial [Rhizoctonia solani AG-8 WAC10335]
MVTLSCIRKNLGV